MGKIDRFRKKMIEENVKIDSALIFGDGSFLFKEDGELDFIAGISYYVKDRSIECRFVF